MFDPVVAHIAGVPVEEVVPLMSIGVFLVRPVLARLETHRREREDRQNE